MSLTETLIAAAEYAVAKTAALGLVSIDNEGVTAVARAVVIEVLDELASREDRLREIADNPIEEAEAAVRAVDYRSTIAELGGGRDGD